MSHFNRRYDTEPCAAAKDAAILAQEEGAKVGRLLLGAGLNPYTGHNATLARIWEESRSEASARKIEAGR